MVALAGVVVVLLWPAGGRTVLVVFALLLLAVVVDLLLAASPRAIGVARGGDTSTRVGETAEVFVTMHNPSSRPARGWVRDAWPPSAGARPRHDASWCRPAARRRVTTTLQPTRRESDGLPM